MSNYLSKLEEGLKNHNFNGELLLTRSGSGSMSFSEARERAFETIMSGPVAGAEGAGSLTRTFILAEESLIHLTFLIYSRVLVSKMILSPELINGGTVILIPFFKIAGLYDDDAVCLFIATSVVSIVNSIWAGRLIDNA